MKTKHDRFERGSGVYKCGVCKKNTRETDEGESNVELCRACYIESGIENEHNDGHHDKKTDTECKLCKKDNTMKNKTYLVKLVELGPDGSEYGTIAEQKVPPQDYFSTTFAISIGDVIANEIVRNEKRHKEMEEDERGLK